MEPVWRKVFMLSWGVLTVLNVGPLGKMLSRQLDVVSVVSITVIKAITG